MPLKNKYLRYSPEITLEIFTLIWNKLIENGWKSEDGDLNRLFRIFLDEDKHRYLRESIRKKTFYPHSFDSGLCETTVQEILGYDPYITAGPVGITGISETFNGEEFVLPEKWYIKCTDESKPHLDKWTGFTWKYVNVYFDKPGRITHSGNIVDGYPEITFDQFKQYVLKEPIEVKQYVPEYVECIKIPKNWINTSIGEIFKTDTVGFGKGCYRVLTEQGGQTTNGVQDHFIPSTKEAFDAQNQSKQPLKQAVHCKTQEEWDFVTEKLGYKWKLSNWSRYKTDSHIGLNNMQNAPAHYWLPKGYQILSFQEWCDLNVYKMENKCEFEVGKWYKVLLKNQYYHIFKFKSLINDNKDVDLTDGHFDISDNKWKESASFQLKYVTEIKELSIEEIQQYLPDGHPDKIKVNQEFKVGDYVVITKSNENWTDDMNKFNGKIVKITSIESDNRIHFNGDENWCFKHSQGHYRHATQAEIQQHLISTGEILSVDTAVGLDCGVISSYDSIRMHYGGTVDTRTPRKINWTTVSEPTKDEVQLELMDIPKI